MELHILSGQVATYGMCTNDEMVWVRMPVALKRAAIVRAERDGVTVAAIIRGLLTGFLMFDAETGDCVHSDAHHSA